MIFNNSQSQYSVLDLGFDKTLTKILISQQGILDVSPELVNVFTGGTSPKTLIAGELISSLEQQTGVVFSGKTGFSNAETGYRLGIDNSDSLIKFYIGTSSDYFNFDGTNIVISGGISAGSIDIGGSDATSFHVDEDGNMWWGSAGSYAAATNKISSTGSIDFTAGTFSGTLSAAAGTLGTITAGTLTGISITGTTIQSASSGARFVVTNATQRLEGFNVNGDVNITMNWSSTTAAVLLLTPIYDARRALEIILPSSFAGAGTEADAKGITIANAADSISIDITDGGLVGLQIAACDTSAIIISNAPTNAAALDFTFSSSDYPVIDMEQAGASADSYGIRIVQGADGLKEGLFIDGNANSNLAECIYLDRDGNSASDVHAMIIESNNSGAGNGVGINLSSPPFAFTFAINATDPTGGGGAATGRIPVMIGGATRYLAYY